VQKLLINTGIVLLLSYLAIAIVVYFRQGSLLYFPDKDVRQTPAAVNLAFEDISFRTRDGITIAGWFVPSEDEKGVLLFCHGNAGNISDRLDSINIFHQLGLSVLIFDYRGYGKSEGRPSERGTYLDAEAAWDYLVKEKRKSPERIILFGRSLGGAVAAETALRKNAALLILESSFTSVPDLALKFYPWLPVRFLAIFRYASIDKVGRIRCPKLIIHSPDDEIVPFGHGTALYDKASGPKEFLRIRGGHNEGFLASGGIYVEGLRDFLSRYLVSYAKNGA